MNKVKSIKIYSTSWCPDCFRSKSFLDEKGIKYENIDIEQKPEFVEVVKEINNGMQSVPTIVIEYEEGSQKILIEPSNKDLADAIGVLE